MKVFVQIGNGRPLPNGEDVSLEEFKQRFPGYQTSNSTVHEQYCWTADVDKNARVWLYQPWEHGQCGDMNKTSATPIAWPIFKTTPSHERS